MSHHIHKTSTKHTWLASASLFHWARTRHRLLPVIVLLTLGTTSAEAATWYVGTSGTNTTSCGSSAAPCGTVSYALSKASAGDTVKIKAGTYTNQGRMNIDKNNITLTADDPLNKPQLLNSTIGVSGSGVTVSYLRVRMGPSPGDLYAGVIDVYNYPTVIDSNELWYGGQGVFIWTSQQVTVSNNWIHDLGVPGNDYDNMCVLITNWEKSPRATSYAQAVRITGNELGPNCSGDGLQENSAQGISNGTTGPFSYLILDNNKCHDNQEQCFDFKGTANVKIFNNDIYRNGFGGISDNSSYGATPNFEIYNNRIHDHEQYAIVTLGEAQAWKVYNNLIYDNQTAPWYNWCAVQLPGDADTVFYGNTVVNNYARSGSNSTCGLMHNGAGSNVKNNVFYNNGNNWGNIYNGHAGMPSYNYVYPVNGQLGTLAVSTCFATNNCPGFVNVTAKDFHMNAGSPAVDAGTPLAAPFTLDADGTARGQGAGWDLGAYEVGGAVGGALAAPTNLTVIP